MSEVRTEYEVSTSLGAVEDGMVRLQVLKMAPWFEVSWNRQRLTAGITVVPDGNLSVLIPVEGISAGDILSPEQLADILVNVLRITLPTCKVFVESVEDDFGFDSEKVKEDF